MDGITLPAAVPLSALMIRATLCSSDQISWRTPIPGRLVHIRLHLNRPVDIVGCYQHTFVNTRQCKHNRCLWTKALNDLLTDLPRRNTLVVPGDWNCGLPQTHPHVGNSHFLHSNGRITGPIDEDFKCHLDLIQMHDLCAINTWRHDIGPTCRTAKGDMSCTDFIFTRLRQTDCVALESMPIESFDLLGPAKIGHRPVVGSINLSWRPASGTALQCITYQSRINCRQMQQDEASWTHFVESNSTQARWIAPRNC